MGTEYIPEKASESRAIAVRAISSLPNISGEMYAHAGKYIGAAVVAAFEMTGGVERLAFWADQNYSDFAVKLLPKVIQRSAQVEHGGVIGIDDAIERLERQNAITAEFSEVADAEYYDL